MSWFTEFSEKAENFLDSIDKNAAKALTKRPSAKAPTYSDDSLSLPSNVVTTTENELSIYDPYADKSNLTSSTHVEQSTGITSNLLDHQVNISSARRELGDNYLRNEMLQNEIHSLNNEISLLLNRVKIAEQKSSDLNEQLITVERKNVKLKEQVSQLTSPINKNEVMIYNFKEDESRIEPISDEKSGLSIHEHYDKQIQELMHDKSNVEETLKKKEDELIMLRSRLSQKTYCFSADELQSRLRALTITLVEKQSSLESLMSEKSTLLTKLNHLQKKYDEALGILHQSRINMNDTDDVKAQIPDYMGGNGLDYFVRSLRSTFTALRTRKRVSFRRVSVLKLMLVVYIIFLHVFIFLLLHTDTPDSSAMRDAV